MAFASMVSSRNQDHTTTTPSLLTQTLPTLLRAILRTLLLAMICCLRVYAFNVGLPSSITPALDDFRVSLQLAHHVEYLTNLFNVATLCSVGFDIR